MIMNLKNQTHLILAICRAAPSFSTSTQTVVSEDATLSDFNQS